MKIKQFALPALIALALTLYHLALYGNFTIEGSLLNYISNFFIVGLLTVFLLNSYLKGWTRFLALFVIAYVFGSMNNLLEAYLFGVTDLSGTIRLLFINLGFGLLVSFSLFYFFNDASQSRQPRPAFKFRSIFQWAWRIITADVLYTFLYVLAGFTLVTVFPQLMDFYEGKIPDGMLVLKVQLCLRGFVFTGTALLITQTTNLPKIKTALLTGLMLSFIGGIAPLMNVNEFMPFFVRMGHLFEVGISNFIFGFLASLLMNTKWREET